MEIEKGINLKIFEVKNKIIEIINESKLPIIVINYILKELKDELSILEQQQIRKEKEEFIKNQEEKLTKKEKVDGNIQKESAEK